MTRTAYWGWTLLLIGILATPGMAQNWKSTQEYDAYMVAYNAKEPAAKAAAAEKFLTDFKGSEATTLAYNMMLISYFNAGRAGAAGAWQKAFDSAEKVTQYVPKPDAEMTNTVNNVGFYAAQALKNNPKTIEYSEKLLAANPNNIEPLIAMSSILSSSFPPDAAARDAQMNKALDITKRALAQPKPAQAPDAAWKDIQVQLHLTTCALLYNKKQYPEAIGACNEVLKLDKKNAASYYYIGLSHEYQVPPLDKRYQDAVVEYNANRTADPIIVAELKAKVDSTLKVVDDKLTEAIDALAKSVAIGGVPAARTELDKLYKGKNSNSLQGLDELIQQKKTELGE
jgi:tetratricopeptide (TPR) repeat protein